jgi:hypothetical protein
LGWQAGDTRYSPEMSGSTQLLHTLLVGGISAA